MKLENLPFPNRAGSIKCRLPEYIKYGEHFFPAGTELTLTTWADGTHELTATIDKPEPEVKPEQLTNNTKLTETHSAKRISFMNIKNIIGTVVGGIPIVLVGVALIQTFATQYQDNARRAADPVYQEQKAKVKAINTKMDRIRNTEVCVHEMEEQSNKLIKLEQERIAIQGF